jgi:hypothetical protein
MGNLRGPLLAIDTCHLSDIDNANQGRYRWIFQATLLLLDRHRFDVFHGKVVDRTADYGDSPGYRGIRSVIPWNSNSHRDAAVPDRYGRVPVRQALQQFIWVED